MKKQNSNTNILFLTELSVLIAIILLMAFTPIGYIKTAGLEITLITIPVIIGAITLGPVAGLILGTVFGITSFLQCILGMSAFGVVLLGINPLFCFLVCVPTRMLMGLVTGLIFNGLCKIKSPKYSITSLSGALLNTLFFMLALILCYWNTDFIQGIAESLGKTSILPFIIAFVGINGLVEAICCFIIAAAISRALDKFIKKM